MNESRILKKIKKTPIKGSAGLFETVVISRTPQFCVSYDNQGAKKWEDVPEVEVVVEE